MLGFWSEQLPGSCSTSLAFKHGGALAQEMGPSTGHTGCPDPPAKGGEMQQAWLAPHR